MVSLKYALTKEDYINYYTYLAWDAPGNKKKRLFYYANRVLPLILFLLAFYYTGLLDRHSNFILIIAGAFIATAFLSLIGVRSNTMKKAEKIAEDPDNASVFLDISVTVSEAGITARNERLETRFQWNAIIKKLESKNYYFLFVNSLQAIIIPKRVFNSPDERLQFERLLAQYLSFEADVSHLLKS